MKNNSIIMTVVAILVIVTSFMGGSMWQNQTHDHDMNHMTALHMSMTSGDMDDSREMFLAMRDTMVGEMINDKQYACCLEKPCTYCIEKTPGHGEGATCSCLDDVMNGKHPCGECIGEILEGHGNPLIAEYFATAVAEEVGLQYLSTMQKIITDKYSIPVEQQV